MSDTVEIRQPPRDDCNATTIVFNRTGATKHLIDHQLHSTSFSPPMYCRCRCLQRSIRIFHSSKQCWKSATVGLLRTSVAFAYTASTLSNRVPLSSDSTLGNVQVRTCSNLPRHARCLSVAASFRLFNCHSSNIRRILIDFDSRTNQKRPKVW